MPFISEKVSTLESPLYSAYCHRNLSGGISHIEVVCNLGTLVPLT